MNQNAAGVADFVRYWERAHARTARLLPLVPVGMLEWRPSPKQFSFGDLWRHLSGMERFVFAEIAAGGENRYPGHGRELADGAEAVRSYYEGLHQQAVALIARLPDAALAREVQTPAGVALPTRAWLRAMLEHESHHRGQLYLMLGMVGVATPPLFGLTSEEVREAARGADAP